MRYNYTDAREYLKRAGTNKMPPLMIYAAITGGFQGKEVNPALPETPEEQAEESRRCYDAGAAMVHIHARDPETGYARPARRKEDFIKVNRLIRSRCPDMIIDNTSGGGVGLTLEERLSSLDAGPEVSDIDMGPLAFALKLRRRLPPLTGRDQDEFTDDVIPITVGETELRARRMKERGILPTLAIFNSGHWGMVYNLIDKGLVSPPYNFLFVLGMTSGAVATPACLLDLLRDAPQPSNAFVFAVSRHDLPMTTMASLLGLHVMIGMETNLYVQEGVLADSNARLVERTVRIARELGRKIATPAQAREMLGLSSKPSQYSA